MDLYDVVQDMCETQNVRSVRLTQDDLQSIGRTWEVKAPNVASDARQWIAYMRETRQDHVHFFVRPRIARTTPEPTPEPQRGSVMTRVRYSVALAFHIFTDPVRDEGFLSAYRRLRPMFPR